MVEIPVIPEAAPFNHEQRLWLNGFLAGWFARVAPTGIPAGSPAPGAPREPLLVLFGSQTGSAEGLARRFARDAEKRGFAPRVLALNDFADANLARAGKAIIISSTWGEGDPPDNAAGFWSWLNAAGAPRLEQLQFAVLGLGDRNYSEFCGAAKKFDERLAALGANRLVPRGECDVDYESPAKSWMETLWGKLDGRPANDSSAAVPAKNGSAHPKLSPNGAGNVPVPRRGKSNPFAAPLLKNLLLNRPGSGKEVRHYEISLAGSDLAYEPGDALGVLPENCPELVAQLLEALHATGGEPVSLGETSVPLRRALTTHFDITKPSPDLLRGVAQRNPGCEWAPLLDSSRRDELKKWLWGRDVLDVLRLPADPLPPEEFLKCLRSLAPRLYSIASSPRAHPGEVHLTVGSVRYVSHGRPRKGVASSYLADRVPVGEAIKVFVQPSHGFKPPADGDTPMIMVGPGTGIAPFRAFLEDRRATGARGRNWLFFGDQKRQCDFLYEEQLTGWLKDGLLTRLELAFSRDQTEKIYVQQRMLEQAGELWSWLEAGAHFYVCGDASRMAKDVDAALHTVIEKAGGRSADEACEYVATLKSQKRYQRDVY
jgi:sulfite reductase (NADPH) flavoprotein alpha-component